MFYAIRESQIDSSVLLTIHEHEETAAVQSETYANEQEAKSARPEITWTAPNGDADRDVICIATA